LQGAVHYSCWKPPPPSSGRSGQPSTTDARCGSPGRVATIASSGPIETRAEVAGEPREPRFLPTPHRRETRCPRDRRSLPAPGAGRRLPRRSSTWSSRSCSCDRCSMDPCRRSNRLPSRSAAAFARWQRASSGSPEAAACCDSLVSVPLALPSASHLRYIEQVKTSTLPPLRVEPRLRSLAEGLLREGETLSSFIVDAVEERVRNRVAEDEFVKRGLASGKKARRSGKYLSAAAVMGGLRRRLDRARKAAVREPNEKGRKGQ
jgi:hypothetical protein